MPATLYGSDSLHPSNVVHIKTAGCLGASLHLEKKKVPIASTAFDCGPWGCSPCRIADSMESKKSCSASGDEVACSQVLR